MNLEDENELQETFGDNYLYADHKKGDAIAYQHPDFAEVQRGRILWVCAPGNIAGHNMSISYFVMPDRGGYPDDVKPRQVVVESEGVL